MSNKTNNNTPSPQSGEGWDGVSYETALQRLEQLTAQMERGDVPINQMADLLKEAQQLVTFCRKQLTDAEQKCNALLTEDENGSTPMP